MPSTSAEPHPTNKIDMIPVLIRTLDFGQDIISVMNFLRKAKCNGDISPGTPSRVIVQKKPEH